MDLLTCEVSKVALFTTFSLLVSILLILMDMSSLLISWVSLTLIYFLTTSIKCLTKNGNNDDLSMFISPKWLMFLVALWVIIPSTLHSFLTYNSSLCQTQNLENNKHNNNNLWMIIAVILLTIIFMSSYCYYNKNDTVNTFFTVFQNVDANSIQDDSY